MSIPTINLRLRRSLAHAFDQHGSSSVAFPSRLSALSATALALVLAQPAVAAVTCPQPTTGSVTCTIPSDQGGSGQSVRIDFTSANGSKKSSGTNIGNYDVDNQGAALGPNSPAAIFVRLRGGRGSNDESDGTGGGAGGIITVTNSGTLAVSGQPSSGSEGGPGSWDDGGAQYGLYVASVGGNGGNADETVIGGGNGGNAGNGRRVTITNSGGVTLSRLPFGGVGIYGASIGGIGGEQDKAALGDQLGGSGGSTDTVAIRNSHAVKVTDAAGSRYAWGIGAEMIAGDGGLRNGDGGKAGSLNSSSPVNIDNSAAVTVDVQGSGFTHGVRGLYVLSQGGNGIFSSDASDSGGAGGSFGGISVVNDGAVSVTSNGGVKPTSLATLSGGIVVLGKGGDGGPGPQKAASSELGGVGGTTASSNSATVTMNSNSVVTTSGDYLPGVSVLSQGGLGGEGREDTDGGAGGAGGKVLVEMKGNARIQTDGNRSHGIVARSYGGAGGGVQTSSGFVDFTKENAGAGGAAGTVTVNTAGKINTSGDDAIGVLGQSMGAVGGTTTDNFELVGNAGTNAGKGGASGTVNIDNKATLETQGASAHGVVAQSIGGGGGVAGASNGIIGIGGNGGTAVTGGTVIATQSGNLTTNGTGAFGVLAQSVGGGGGDGGSNNGVIVVGGEGGDGGAGGTSSANVNGYVVRTKGDQGYGVVSQAIGGGGGTGGSAAAYSAGVGFSLAVAVGGSGGKGGAGGQASSTVTGASIITGTSGVTTEGNDAHALVVQSIGGGGGAGGSSVAKSYAIAPPTDAGSVAVAASIAVGGSGGDGGGGSTASASLGNSIVRTYGANSMGAVVQSIGGGGGMGGSGTATSTVVGTEDSVGGTVEMAVGGTGGSGSDGGLAKLSVEGSQMETFGESANAILVQSVGGGGGAGGVGSATGKTYNTQVSIDLNLAVGGKGDGGGNGGMADLTIAPNSSITTHGDGARGALVQSIGGGGGVSQGAQVGLAFSAESEDGNTDVTSTVAVGRNGAKGGNGGDILLNVAGKVTTYGADADGLLVQSIGGSGGLAGSVGGDDGDSDESSRPSLDDGSTSYTLNASVGGTGGGAGKGGSIGTAANPASLGASTQTYGDYADAVVLQSIGGGGGAGGVSTSSSSLSSSNISLSIGGNAGPGGAGGDITTFLNGNTDNAFLTQGYGAMGLLMQSIGGGGGTAGTGSPLGRGKITVGGNSAAAGDGGNITIVPASFAAIETSGDSAYGMVLQTLGAGGGIGMAGSSRSANTAGKYGFDLHAGGALGNAKGGDITVSTGLALNTYGDRAMGVIAQSIGGGGGIATAGSALATGGTTLGGVSGAGGTITLNLSGGVSTVGAGAHGIVAQSIGGGGGIVGDVAQAIQFNPAGFRSGGQSDSVGGSVTINSSAEVLTWGKNAHGIVAQSIGGGGGLGGNAQGGFAGSTGQSGTGGTVAVTVNAPITSMNEGSSGIFAQSQGGLGNSRVSVIVNDQIQGGSGSGAGVWIAAGNDNPLTVNAGGSVSAISGVAVRYSGDRSNSAGSRLNIDNYGILNGSVLCSNTDGSSACSIINHTGAVASGATAYNASVQNDGLLVIGKPGQFETLTVSGNLTQSASGTLRADVDFDQMRSSTMVVQGDADLGGKLDVLPRALLPNKALTVLTVQGATQGALTALDSPVFDYETRSLGQSLQVRVANADFKASGLGLKKNQRNVANHLQRIWDSGGNRALAPLFAQLDLASRAGAAAYRKDVTSLSPGIVVAPAAQSAANIAQFTGAMMSCPTFTGTDQIMREQNCAWGQVTGRSTKQDGADGVSGFDFDTVTYQFGGQREVSPGWFVGGSAAYQNNHLRATDRKASGHGDSGYAGAVVKRQTGPWVFAAALGAGYGRYAMDRQIEIAGFEEKLESRPDVYSVNARLRAARYVPIGQDMYLKPYVDLDANYTKMPGYRESGSNPLALSVKDADQFVLGLSPMLEFGGRKELNNKAVLRPFVYAGVSLLSQDNWKTSARLRGAPAGTGSFDTSLPMDNVVGKVGAGLQVTQAGRIDFRLQYDGQFGQKTRSNAATLKVMVPF